MINREEQLARIKQQIAKAIGEIEHGDQAAALLALVDAFKIREELHEADYEHRVAHMPIVVAPGEGDHPRVSEMKEPESFAGLPEEQQSFAGDPAVLAKQRKRR